MDGKVLPCNILVIGPKTGSAQRVGGRWGLLRPFSSISSTSMIFRSLLFLFFLHSFPSSLISDSSFSNSKSAVSTNLCSPNERLSCGSRGACVQQPLGARCRCSAGWMGQQCSRPCQDIYQSCDRWRQEGRCHWVRPGSAFFLDNCPFNCGVCQQKMGQKNLPIPLPPLLEPLAWMIGRWETQTLAQKSDRFPTPMPKESSYTEILDIQPSDVPAFDRPPLNISVRAWSEDGGEEHNELGFMTTKPAHEDTGFVGEEGERRDRVALELVSNTGTMSIEEGELVEPGVLSMEVRWSRGMGTDQGKGQMEMRKARRSFRLVNGDTLEERLDYPVPGTGIRKRVAKQFRRVHDYLRPQ